MQEEYSLGNVKIKRDTGFDRISKYYWINVEVNGIRVGKARVRISDRKLIINSLIIFPEYQGRGYARLLINYFKENFDEIVADRVRNIAKEFWEKMNFRRDFDGNYIWKK